MSIFGTIAKAIFGLGSAQASEAAPAASSPTAPASAPPAATAPAPAAKAAAAPAAAAAVGSAVPNLSALDMTALLDGLADKSPEDLDWRKSIVDLMKLLKLDSSLKARKSLATELGYSGDQGDSATMNMWLHKQVMKKLAENGGNVPADLKD
jgi:3-oxoacyl-ACP reductase-like protein